MKTSRTGSRTFAVARLLAIIATAIILAALLTVTALMQGKGKPASATRSANRTSNNPTQRALSPQPVSVQAVRFAETRKLSEIVKKRNKNINKKTNRHNSTQLQNNSKTNRKGLSALRREAAGGKENSENDEEESEAAENRAIKHVTPEAQAAAEGGLARDGAMQTHAPSLNMPNPITTFEGLGRTENIAAGVGSLAPPDTNGYVGPNHYVQQDNLLVRVWNKTGTPLTAPFRLSSLFTALGGQCASPDQGDPVVLYDKLADRWMLSQFAFADQFAAPYHQCIAISKTPDPTGAYYTYDFITAGNEFPDYPKLGVWPDGYYMMVHQFTLGNGFNGTGVYSFNRAKMVAGDPTANYIYFNLNLTNFPEAIGGMLPSDLDGLTPPPAGRPNTFVYFTTTDFSDPANGLRLFDFHSDFTTPANSTFTERAESTYNSPLPVAAFSVVTPTNSRSAVPQPGGNSNNGLDAITDRLMHRLQYRNFGGYETLVMTHNVGAPASTTYGTFRAAPRYYELRKTGAGLFAVQEQATFAPADGISRWMGSVAEDNQGNLAIGYNVSDGTSVFPGIRYAGRLATDPANSLAQGEATLINGTGIQTSTGNRWGDYSALTVDPVDDCTFWYTTEYYTAAGQAASSVGWQTRIGNFKFTQCTAPAKGKAHFTVTNCTTAANLANAVVTVDGVFYGVTATDGTFDVSLAPGSHPYSITRAGFSIAAGNVNITNGNTTNVPVCLDSGTAHFVVTDCTTNAAISGAAVSVDGNAVGTTGAGGLLDVALAPGSHNYAVSKAGYAPAANSFSVTANTTTNVPACLQGIATMVANGASVTVDANANGAIDPGEAVTVSFGLKNNGAGATSNLVATLQATGGVTSPGGPATYGVIAAGGGTGAQPISFTASAALVCGNTLTATLHLQDGATDLGNVTYNFTVCPIVMVTATAGTVGPTLYATLKAAFDAINAGTHQGAVTVSIFSGTTEGTTPATLNGSGAGAALYTSVLIRPTNDGVSISGNPAGGFGVIQLNGASNVTIDGDNPNTAGTNRNLTVQNTATNTSTFTSDIRIALATTGATTANNDTFKNLNLLGSATGRNTSGAASSAGSENTTFGILATAGSTGVTAAPSPITSVSTTIGSPATATNLLIQNNSINDAGRAIGIVGAATTVFPGLLIQNNIIGNATAAATDQVYSAGVTAEGTSDGIIRGNTIYVEGFVSTSSSGANQAISLGTISAIATLTVEKNNVLRVRNNAPDTWPAIGINLGGGNNHVVQNNFVADIRNDQTAGTGGSSTTFGAYGIRVASGTGHKIYHNSVNLFGTLLGATSTDLTAAFMIVNTSQTGMDVRDNVFSNRQTGGNPTTTNTRHTAIYLPSGATNAMNLTLNNNAYLQGPSVSGALSLLAKVGTAAGTGEYFAVDFNPATTTPATNLRAYTSTLSAAGTNDNASLASTSLAPFISNTDLHITGANALISAGVTIAGVTNDIDNDPRPASNPDMGADEIVQAAAGSIPPGTFYNMSGGTGDSLSGNVTVTNTLYLNGQVATGANTLTLDCNASAVGGGASNYVIGNLKKNYCDAGLNTFDVGTANGYSPVDVNVTAGTFATSLTVKANQGLQPNFASPQYSLQRYWTLTGTNLTADLTFHYLDPTDIPGTANENVFVIFKYNGSFTTPGGSVNAAGNTASISGVSSFSDWTLAQPNSPTASPGSISGTVTTANGLPLAGVAVQLNGDRTRTTITNSDGNYRFDGVGVGEFFTVTPSLANFNFSPRARSFSLLGNKTDATFTAAPDAVETANAIDANEYFVRQQYLDFLGREPDAAGLEFWTGKLSLCNGDAVCLARQRIEVSAAFFLSQEFRDTGSFVFRLYKGTLGRQLGYSEFSADRAQVVGGPNLESSKAIFADAFVQRAEFGDKYQGKTTAEGFVDALLQTMNDSSGVNLANERAALINRYREGVSQNASRASVVRQLVDNDSFAASVYNQQFVAMQYFGYLRRTPDTEGFNFWVSVMNNNASIYRGMVCSFITSTEYQRRFSSVVTHSNKECDQ